MKRKIFNLILINTPRSLVLLIDLVVVLLNFVLSFFIQNDFHFTFDLQVPFRLLPIVFGFSIFSFIIIGSYRGVIKHTGLRDSINIYIGASITFVLLLIYNYYLHSQHSELEFTLSIVIIHYLLNVLVLVSNRFLYKYIYYYLVKSKASVKNVVIYGAGDLGSILYATLQRNNSINTKVIAFVDDDLKKHKKTINGISILPLDAIDYDFIYKNQVSEVIIAVKNLSTNKLISISDFFLNLPVKIKIVPPISKWVEGDLKVNQIKEVRIEDLLNRMPIDLENKELDKKLDNKRILVTGGAGSIGSEIVKQLASYHCEKIIVVDIAESCLYELQQDLFRLGKKNIQFIVGDVRDFGFMESLFNQYQFQVIFHAAAYKHVPLMEENPYEAVKINILGTKNVADLSVKYQVEKFVMVSTDKAVNPTNVMGTTKRIAELYISSINPEKTKFTITRFGNVLGSNGSVIPLFKKQIAEGGPVTVTHPEITRYFMTIPEACQLVIEAGFMGEGGEIYVFDMGDSVKIFDLARRMIRLSGYQYPSEIDIVFSGLRPGEKLYEELLKDEENTLPTHHKKIMISKTQEINKENILKLIEELIENNIFDNPLLVVKKMKAIVPEYKSQNSVFEQLD